jgi:hypothetical protein
MAESNDPTQEPPPAPPAQPQPQPQPGFAAAQLNNWPTGARMPILGNAEWAMWLLVEIIFALVWATSDAVDGGAFAQLTAITTFAYLISRGIAKAGRVLER